MIISQPRAVRRNSSVQSMVRRQYVKAVEGEECVVLVAGRYNGPDHKSLGFCPEGSVIRVATGAYLEHNVANGLLQPVADLSVSPDEQVVVTAVVVDSQPGEQPGDQPASSYKDLLPAGVTERQAKALYEAGFTSKATIQTSFGVFGLNEIVAVKGITEAKACELVKWAGVVVPED